VYNKDLIEKEKVEKKENAGGPKIDKNSGEISDKKSDE